MEIPAQFMSAKFRVKVYKYLIAELKRNKRLYDDGNLTACSFMCILIAREYKEDLNWDCGKHFPISGRHSSKSGVAIPLDKLLPELTRIEHLHEEGDSWFSTVDYDSRIKLCKVALRKAQKLREDGKI